ncbi:MAG: DUF4153 domain-containing protein [Gemmatimonadota bacterium]
MRFPSIAALGSRARTVLLRFPWVLAVGAIAATAAIISIERHDDDVQARLSIVAALGLPLLTALTLLGERLQLRGWRRTGLVAAGALFLIWFFKAWPGPDQKHDVIRYFQLSIGLHLTVSFLPFLPSRGRGAFWQFNRTIFEAFLRAVLFTLVLYLGLVVALVALDKLFGISIPSNRYAELWILLALVANTWIFLSGVPDDFGALEQSTEYPRGLKVLTQYILTPLVAVYLVILMLYLVKIVVTGSWPNGWIGYLVSSVAVTGMLGFLLVHPLRDHAEEGWIRTYSRWLFIGLIPAAVMFLLALSKRVHQYGLTELRFLGLLLGGWLLGIALLYSVRGKSGVQVIPVSLSILLLFTLFGPVSATTFSLRSQAARLHSLLETNHLIDGTRSSTPPLSDNDRREISASLRFLLERHAGNRIAGISGGKLPGGIALRDSTSLEIDSTAAALLAALGAEYAPEYGNGSSSFTFQARSDSNATPIGGYDFSVALSGTDSTTFFTDDDTLKVFFDTASVMLRIQRQADTLLMFPFRPMLDSLLRNPNAGYLELPPARMRVTVEGSGYRGMMALDWLMGARDPAGPRIRGWRGELYIGRVDPPR